MTLNLEEIEQLVAEHEEIIRVLIVATQGSTPRDTGTRMLVWTKGQKGTIGGGALEYKILDICHQRLAGGKQNPLVISQPLGPGLGQCCGGHVKFVLEYFNIDEVNSIKAKTTDQTIYGRPIERDIDGEVVQNFPSVENLPVFKDGWLLEQLVASKEQLWVFGSGHVGTAIVNLVSKLPSIEITWIDFQEDRFPTDIPAGVNKVVATDPEQLTKYAPTGGLFLVLTHSHDLDLKIMEGFLRKDFSYLGLIGSRTKWSRFKQRLLGMGLAEEVLNQVKCPIGKRDLGKHPWQIAVGFSTELLEHLKNSR